MIDRESLTAAARWGASLGTRVDVVSEAGLSPWRLAESGGTADYRPSKAGHLENPGITELHHRAPLRCSGPLDLGFGPLAAQLRRILTWRCLHERSDGRACREGVRRAASSA